MAHVARTETLGPHMRRIILIGDDLQDFPSNKESAHIKVVFPQPGQEKPRLGIYFGFKKWIRSYTIRAFNNQTKELTVDVAVNDPQGLATDWALNAKAGDYLGIAGPCATKHTNNHADWHLLVADLTALPAAAAILEKLPENALGSAFIQVPTDADKQIIEAPKGIDVNWVINPDLSENALLERVEKLEWREGEPALFIAAESSQVLAIKKYVKNKPGYLKKQMYASAYWKA
jgi:NADPH-dependent ferric siderophore reductase